MSRYNRCWVLAAVSTTVVLILISVKGYVHLCRLFDYDPEISASGESFQVDDVQVCTFFGHSDDGDRLRYAIIIAWPISTPPNSRLADHRFDMNSGQLPKVRHRDGVMRRVETDGRVYLFIGDELRTMRVDMNEHTDTIGLAHAGSLEGMWSYLQQFRVD